MYPSFNQLKIQNVSLSYENWQGLLAKPVPERPEFLIENGVIRIGRVIAEFLGMPLDIDEYYNQLYDYVHSEEWNINLLSEDSLNKSINNQHFQAVQKVLTIYHEQRLSINRFTAYLDGEQLLLKSKNHVLHRKLREAMIDTLELFSNKEDDGLKNSELRRVLVDLVKWSINHLEKPLSKADPQQQMPRFLWYGDFKKSHQYFLYFLIQLGCDLIIFHPEGKDPLSEMIAEPIFVHHYPKKLPAEAFPTEKRMRKTTIAYRASREIETILNEEGSGLYKPWQLRDYLPSSITLRTTYDELFILGKEMAMIRPNFEAFNGIVKIPSLFAKIQGVSKNRKEYWDRLQALTKMENSLLIRHFPFTVHPPSDFRFHYRNALGSDGLLCPEKIIQAHYWAYGHLPIGLQKGIAAAIRNVCENSGLKPLNQESPEELRIYLFSHLTKMPKSIIQLLEKFDYSQNVPKLILYNNEMHGNIQRSDAAVLLLLNTFGIDIIVYNPPGHNDIENYLAADLFDTHWLDDVVFDLEYKEPSRLKKGLIQTILKNFKGD
jgi:hypothetical protein